MLHVLFVSDDENDIRIGAVKAPHRLAEALDLQGCECTLLFREDLGSRPSHERLRFALAPWLAWRAVCRAWRERGPFDVIDAAGAEGFVLGLLRNLSCYRDAALVVRSHGLDRFYLAGLAADHRAGLLRKPWYRRILYYCTRVLPEAAAYRCADAAIVLNRAEQEFLGPRTRLLRTIPHGVLRERWEQAPPPDASRGAGVLFSGTWHTGKGIHYLAEAYRLLHARGVTIPMTLLSGMEDGPEFATEERWIRRYFAPACQAGLTVLRRSQDQNEVFALYRSHDLLVCPSSTEGFGMVVLEAMSQRLPVVCSRAAGAAELLEHDRDALLVAPRDAAALAAALERLWLDPALRRRLAEAGHARLAELTWSHAAAATQEVYRAVGQTASGAPSRQTLIP